jgi:hypothetical protein
MVQRFTTWVIKATYVPRDLAIQLSVFRAVTCDRSRFSDGMAPTC